MPITVVAVLDLLQVKTYQVRVQLLFPQKHYIKIQHRNLNMAREET